MAPRKKPAAIGVKAYRAKSSEGNVRHPFFRGLREDL
jgi:hypothetical protein